MRTLLNKIRKLLKDRRTRRFWSRTVSFVAALVVFVTTYALVLPAITMERQAYCGLEAHQHTDDCFERQLICTIPESPGHHHDDSCYTMRQEYSCTLEEHLHADGCYDEEGNLICEIPEHTHEEGTCWQEVPELTCTLEESDGHQHGDSCYENVLVCGKEVHTHSEACYENPDELLETAAVATTQEGAYGISSDEGFDGAGTDGSGDSDGSGDEIGWTDSDDYGNAARNDDPSTGLTDPDNAANSINAAGSDAAELDAAGADASGSDAAGTDTLSEEAQQNLTSAGINEEEDRYVPQLDPLFFNAVLNKHTDIYYYHVPEGETVEDSSLITEWKKADKSTELGPNDLLRVYLSYTIPAGSLNETNPTASYRLPANLHLTDDQVNGINAIENGIAAAYIDYNTLTVTDPDNYHRYLGAEAVEGTRTPDQTLEEYLAQNKGGSGSGDSSGSNAGDTGGGMAAGQEFISATVRAQNVYDTEGLYGEKGAYLGQDLIFTFSPYTIEKNQHTYDASGQPTRAGQKVRGWFALDFNLTQVDLDEPYIEEVENFDNIENIEVDSNRENENIGENTVVNTGDENAAVSDDDSDTTVLISREFRTANIVFVEKNDSLNLDEISASIKVVTAENYERVEANPDDAENTENIEENGEEQLEENAEGIEEDLTGQEAEAGEDAEGTDNEDKSDADDEDKKKEDLTAEDEKDKDKTVSQDDESEKTIMPAMSFEDSIRVRTGKPAGVEDGSAGSAAASAAEALPKKAKVTVRVEADEGTFPAGTTMVLSAVEDLDAVAETVKEAVENGGDNDSAQPSGSKSNKDNTVAGTDSASTSDNNTENKNPKTYGFQAVDISFRDVDGNEIEPAKPVRVALTSEIVEQIKADKEANENTSIDDPVVVHLDDGGNAEKMDLIAPEEIEPAQGKTEEELLEEMEKAKEQKESDEKSVPENDKGGQSAVDDKDSDSSDLGKNTNISEAETAENESEEQTVGEENMTNPENDLQTFEEQESLEQASEKIDDNQNKKQETGDDAQIENSSVYFETESFSVYAIVYTVDFYWEVDGKTYKFILTGGDSISLQKLVDVLGIIQKDSLDPKDDIINDESNDTTALNTLSMNENPEIVRFINDIEKIEFSDENLIKTVQITESVTVSELKKQFDLQTEYSAELTEEQIIEMEAKQFTPPDWALMVLKHFDTEEALTVIMKNGEVLKIKVTDPVTDRGPENMQVLTTVDTRSQGVKMWLFDYDLAGKLDHQDNKANQLYSYNVAGTNIKYGNYGINQYSDLKFLGWGAGNSEKSYESAGNTGFGINDFTGLDENNTNRIRALQGIVQNELVGGYPVLQNGESLNYLFDPTLNTADRNVYGGNTKESGNITGLFELDNNGYYIYDSDEHYAELSKQGNNYTNNFTVYTSTLAQTNKNGGNHNPVRAVGFFPFDSYSHVYSGLKYEYDGNHYDDYGTLYVNPDGDQGNSGLNHHIGVAMEMDFVMPKGGKTEEGAPIQFRFSGDDDMWVFIDDQLVLDIGGLHQPVDGVIDFSTGKATITGKATVSGHSDNTGSAAIGVVKDVTDNRGNNFEFYPSLGLTDGDGKTHTMKIFYLERGGCDSNCMISFNLPLVKGKGDVTIAKYDSTANPVAPLPGVKFGIYSNPQCTDLIEEVTSSSAGLLDFSDLGIKNDDQKYYIKETQPLPGYKPNDTIYTLKAEDDGANGYTFGVYVYNEEGVYNNKIDTIGNQSSLPVIYNEERKPIDLTVEKVWQKPTMEAFTPTEDDNLSATFKVQRYIRSEGDRVITDTSQPVTFKVYRIKNGNTTQLDSEYTLKGKSKVYVNWSYRQSYINYDTNRFNKYKYNTTSGSYLTKNGNRPLEITLPENGTVNLYIRDEDLGTVHGNGVVSITVNGTPYSPQNTTEHFTTDWVPDDAYNDADTCPELSLPEDKIDADHPWRGKFTNLPLYKTEGGITYYYKYYIIEVDPNDGFETIYIDGDGKYMENPSSLATDESNTSSPQVIINRKLINIPVEKTWPDYDDDEFTWTAKFQLDYRNVPLDGESEEDDQEPSGNDEEPPEATTWPVYEPAQYVEISKGDTEQKFFEDLPMYYTDEDGVTWRREYSVREIEYNVWRVGDNGTKIEPPIISKGQNGTTGFEYTLWYRQDAGEDYNDDGVINEADYVISVENMLAHREVSREIDIGIDKTWPAGTTYATSSDAKAIFNLKRYVVEEYRNYENVPNGTSWVDITLKTGDGNDQTLRVPQGQGMYIRGYLKGGSKNQNITFTCSAGQSIPAYSNDNSSNPDQKAFSIGFTADTSKTIQLQSGADYVSGGIRGFHLSDTNSMLPAEVDRHFSEEFELNSGNSWHAAFEDLPFVEVVQMNDGKTATTFVYSYFFEEIECVPETFYALFTDSSGQVLLGDENNRIVFATDITASNLPIGFDILKVDVTNNSLKLPGAEFTLRKLNEDDQLHYPVSTNNGTFTGTSAGTAETVQGTGKTSFEGLLPGYYEVSETKAPDGYVLLSDSAFYLKVEKSGDIKLLKKQTQNDRMILVEANPNELVGNATIDSSISSDGKTIIATVRNEPGAALPSAGGPGTRLYLLLGGALIAIAGALLIRRRRAS